MDETRDDPGETTGRAAAVLASVRRVPGVGHLVASGERFFAIGGLDLGGLIAVELFTTVLPLLLIGYAWWKDFDRQAGIGELFVQQFGAEGSARLIVRREFGNAAGLERVWTVIGLASFLVWGIPMSLTVARMFALAWQRPQHVVLQRLWRGTVWFVAYLATMAVVEAVQLASDGFAARPFLLAMGVLASTLLWGLSPWLLVPGVPRSWRTVLIVGLAGAIVNVLVMRTVVRLVFPLLLSGWDGFGPIGVALTIMTWCGVTGATWVVVACLGAVLTERLVRRDDGVATAVV